ncbi:MAG: hypothetical protein AAGF76_11615 [Pseudomonadota bacterium]
MTGVSGQISNTHLSRAFSEIMNKVGDSKNLENVYLKPNQNGDGFEVISSFMKGKSASKNADATFETLSNIMNGDFKNKNFNENDISKTATKQLASHFHTEAKNSKDAKFLTLSQLSQLVKTEAMDLANGVGEANQNLNDNVELELMPGSKPADKANAESIDQTVKQMWLNHPGWRDTANKLTDHFNQKFADQNSQNVKGEEGKIGNSDQNQGANKAVEQNLGDQSDNVSVKSDASSASDPFYDEHWVDAEVTGGIGPGLDDYYKKGDKTHVYETAKGNVEDGGQKKVDQSEHDQDDAASVKSYDSEASEPFYEQWARAEQTGGIGPGLDDYYKMGDKTYVYETAKGDPEVEDQNKVDQNVNDENDAVSVKSNETSESKKSDAFYDNYAINEQTGGFGENMEDYKKNGDDVYVYSTPKQDQNGNMVNVENVPFMDGDDNEFPDLPNK